MLGCALAALLAVSLTGCGGSTTPSASSEGSAPAKEAPAKKASVKGVDIKDTVDDYSWGELAKISSAMTDTGDEDKALQIAEDYNLCGKNGKLDGSQIKHFNADSGKTSGARIIGFYHDDLSDGSGKAGITWQFTESVAVGSPDATWERNYYRTDMNTDDGTTILSAIPSEIRTRLVAVDKMTDNDPVYLGDNDADSPDITDESMANSKSMKATKTSDKLFLLSLAEVAGDVSDFYNRDDVWMADIYAQEGTQYAYFNGLNVKYGSDETNPDLAAPGQLFWWDGENYAPVPDEGSDSPGRLLLRSIVFNEDGVPCGGMFISNSNGTISESDAATSGSYSVSCGLMPAFCIAATEEDLSNSESSDSDSGNIKVQEEVDDYSWKDLKAIADEIAAADSDEAALSIAKSYNLCDEDGSLTKAHYKTVELTDGSEAKAQIVGFNHDDRSDGKGKAGISFLFEGDIAEHDMNGDGASTGGWEDSDLRSWLEKDGWDLLPKDLQKVIVEVSKKTNNAGVTSDVSSVTSTDDKLWIPSLVEIVGTASIDADDRGYMISMSDGNEIYKAEGAQYAAFSSYDINNDDRAAIAGRDADDQYWTRTSWANEKGLFYSMNILPLQSSSDTALSVVPGFCL